MLDWFRGYRHGAAVARESGYREAIVIPASAALPRFRLPAPPSDVKPQPMLPPDEQLPLPCHRRQPKVFDVERHRLTAAGYQGPPRQVRLGAWLQAERD